MQIEGSKSLPSHFGQLTADIFDAYPVYKFKIPSTIINNYLPDRLADCTLSTWINRAKRYSIYSKPLIYASRLQLSSNVEKLSNSVSLSDVLEELLTESDPTIRYNFVIMDDCLIFTRVAQLHHIPYYILGKHISLSNRSRDVRFAGELWYDKDNGFQLNNNSGTYRLSQDLIGKTVDLFNYLTPELQFTGTGFQQNSLPELSTGQGNPALPCTLPCPAQGRVRIFLIYPALVRAGYGRAGCRAGQGETLYPGNLNIKF